jgi:hypothetical protein
MLGLIGFYQLEHWWLNQLSESERARLEELFHPLGSAFDLPLTQGNILRNDDPTATKTMLIGNLIGWLQKTPVDLTIRIKLLSKLAAELSAEDNLLARHYCLQVLIQEHYRDRLRSPKSRELAIQACRDQIAIAAQVAALMQSTNLPNFPTHVGYEQLAIILEKDSQFAEAIAICMQAKLEGWTGNWHARIERCRTKLSSTQQCALTSGST